MKKAVGNNDSHLAMQVVNYVRTLLEQHALKPGDKLPPERNLSRKLKISRASLRAGINSLAAMGIIEVRHGIGNFITDAPPAIGQSSLALLSALHGFKLWQMFETRRILEGNLASLAAERGTKKQLKALAAELEGMTATVERPAGYLLHDINFHRTVSQASGNPILAAMMETITASLYEDRKRTVEHTSDLTKTTGMHREIYNKIRARNPAAAKRAMEQHLEQAEAGQHKEKRGRGTRQQPHLKPAPRRGTGTPGKRARR